jgi:hypothetical protein
MADGRTWPSNTREDALSNHAGDRKCVHGHREPVQHSGGLDGLAAEYIAQTRTLTQYMSAPFGSCGVTRVTLGKRATRVLAGKIYQ